MGAERRAKTRVMDDGEGGEHLVFRCPGCDCFHATRIAGPSVSWQGHWAWNGDCERATVLPSILIRIVPLLVVPTDRPDAGLVHVCHSRITDGQIQFLGDSTHALAGQTVELPEWEDS